MIFDTHAHLNTKQFDDDLNQVIINAKLSQVNYILVIGMDLYHNKKAIEIANQNKGIYAAVGIHPCDVADQKIADLIPLLNEKKVVAIGEIGIDLYWKQDNLKEQTEVFVGQIELAIKYDLPVIIHTRESFSQAYQAILPYKGKVRGVFHCLTSSLEDALAVIDLGMYVGIGGVVTFNKASEVHKIAKEIPLNKIIVETDSPYLAPIPFRGKRNEPAYTKYVVNKIAELKNISTNEVAKQTTKNAFELFRINEDVL